tara:strand:+ start:12177 stop:12389 length:213 start_codon:yes stop_codon:yes gene_type:complete
LSNTTLKNAAETGLLSGVKWLRFAVKKIWAIILIKRLRPIYGFKNDNVIYAAVHAPSLSSAKSASELEID